MTSTAEGSVVASEETTVPKTKTRVRPLGDRVFVLELRPGTTPSGIIIPDSAKGKTLRGIIVATGPGPRSPFTAQVADMGLKVGDHVLYSEMVGQELTVDGQDLLVLREVDIICVVSQVEEEEQDG